MFVRIRNTTPGFVIYVGIAVRALCGTGLDAGLGHGASGRGGNGHEVRARVVRTFEDIDLAIFGPVIQTRLPDCGPCRAALWHVSNIEAGDGETEDQRLILWDSDSKWHTPKRGD